MGWTRLLNCIAVSVFRRAMLFLIVLLSKSSWMMMVLIGYSSWATSFASILAIPVIATASFLERENKEVLRSRGTEEASHVPVFVFIDFSAPSNLSSWGYFLLIFLNPVPRKFFFPFFWSVVDLQCCISFWYTEKWFSFYIQFIYIIYEIHETFIYYIWNIFHTYKCIPYIIYNILQ